MFMDQSLAALLLFHPRTGRLFGCSWTTGLDQIVQLRTGPAVQARGVCSVLLCLVQFPLWSSWSLSSAAWEFNDSLPVDVSEISHKHVSSLSGIEHNSQNGPKQWILCWKHGPVNKTCDTFGEWSDSHCSLLNAYGNGSHARTCWDQVWDWWGGFRCPWHICSSGIKLNHTTTTSKQLPMGKRRNSSELYLQHQFLSCLIKRTLFEKIL